MILVGASLCIGMARAEDDAAAKGKGIEARRAEMIKKYDKNGDGTLDETERNAMRDEQKKKRDAERLKKYDKNGDGQLDDAEKEAMRDDLKKMRETRIGTKDKPGEHPPTPPAPPAPAAAKEAPKN